MPHPKEHKNRFHCAVVFLYQSHQNIFFLYFFFFPFCHPLAKEMRGTKTNRFTSLERGMKIEPHPEKRFFFFSSLLIFHRASFHENHLDYFSFFAWTLCDCEKKRINKSNKQVKNSSRQKSERIISPFKILQTRYGKSRIVSKENGRGFR